MHKHIYSQTQRKIMKEDREKRKLTESDGELNQKFTSVLSSKEECETLTECNSDVSEANRMSFCDLNPMSPENSTCNLSPWNQTQPSPYLSAPWPDSSAGTNPFSDENFPQNGLISCLVREEGHIYSLAAKGDLLYTGSDSKNIRVWKNQKEYSVFKSNSGLVKAIVISGEKIFTGHQDGKIRVWRVSAKKSTQYKRLATLPTRNDFLRSSFKPSNYIKVGRHRNTLWLKHVDAISCLSLDEEQGLLYSGSWDKTLKVWRISDSKCLESITAHDDAVNAVVAAFDSLIFTGSADGTVKVWRRELLGTGTKHFFQQSLLKQECAVTALTVNLTDCVVYCGSSDGKINLWERDKMLSHSGILSGHKQAVLCLATTTRGLLFSGSADKMIYVWKRENGVHTCMSILSGHMGPVKCLAVEEDPTVSGDGNGDRRWIVYSGSLDKSVKMWQVSEQAMEGELARRRQAT